MMGTPKLGALAGGLAALAAVFLVSVPLRAHAAGSAAPAQPRGALVMVQGSVTSIEGDTVDIETPPVYPVCRPGTACPMYIIAGERLSVRLTASTAVDSSDGLPVSRAAIEVGTWLAAAGHFQAEPSTQVLGRTLEAVLVGVGRVSGSPYPCGTPEYRACPEGKA